MTEQQLQHEIDRLKKWNKWFFYRVKFMRQCQREYFRMKALLRKDNVSPMERDEVEQQAKDWLKKSKMQKEDYQLSINEYMGKTGTDDL